MTVAPFSFLDIKKARRAYQSQKHGAKRRGIGFHLTFAQWLEFWGKDIDARGVRAWSLGMQRPEDGGDYEVGNIRKGTPKDNGRTRAAMHHKPGPAVVTTVRGLTRAPEDNEDGTPNLGYASVWNLI